MRAAWVSLALGMVGIAHAQPDKPAEAGAVTDDTVARADALFAEGKRLFDSDLHAACAKFDAAFALNSQAIGIVLNVALCQEKLGRVASADAKFRLAREMATEQNLAEHRKAADEHIAALAPRIPRVSIVFAAPPSPDTTVVIDGTARRPDDLTKIAVDPGQHEVVVSAPGYVAHRASFQVAEGEKRDIAIPVLAKSITVRSSRKTVGLIVGGTGAAVGVTGIVLGLVARSRYRSAESCHTVEARIDCDDASDFAVANKARSLGAAGTVVGIAGGVAVVVGGILWWTGRSSERAERAREGITWLPQVGPDSAGFAAAGRF